MFIKRNTIPQKVDILAEKKEENINGNKKEVIKCHVCQKNIDTSRLPVACSKNDCPFS